MSQITSQYDSAEQAASAVERLRRQGFHDEAITLTQPAGDQRQRQWAVRIQAPFGMGRIATEILQRFEPSSTVDVSPSLPLTDLEWISYLSGPVSPGAISWLSRPKPVGAIRPLSAPKSPGAISVLSRPKPTGAIPRLSRPVPVGAIARLSQPKPVGAISRLSDGWYVSDLFHLPLLTRRQKPLEPDDTLLGRDDVAGRRTWRR